MQAQRAGPICLSMRAKSCHVQMQMRSIARTRVTSFLACSHANADVHAVTLSQIDGCTACRLPPSTCLQLDTNIILNGSMKPASVSACHSNMGCHTARATGQAQLLSCIRLLKTVLLPLRHSSSLLSSPSSPHSTSFRSLFITRTSTSLSVLSSRDDSQPNSQHVLPLLHRSSSPPARYCRLDCQLRRHSPGCSGFHRSP